MRLLIILLGLAAVIPVYSETAYLKSENTRRPIHPWNAAESKQAEPATAQNGSYRWAAFQAAPDQASLKRMEAQGARFIGYAGKQGDYEVYKVKLEQDAAQAFEQMKAEKGFVNLLPILPEEKLARSLYQRTPMRGLSTSGKVKATVFFHRTPSPEEARRYLEGKVDSLIPDPAPGMIHVIASLDRILALAALDEVARVEEFQERLPLNDSSRNVTRVNALQAPYLDTLSFPPTPYWNSRIPYTGDSVWVCISYESYDPAHRDFREWTPGGYVLRSYNSEGQWGSEHGTHVAGIAAGNGFNSESFFDARVGAFGRRYQWRGVAPKALLSASREDGDVNNHSVTNGDQGYYNYDDAAVDMRVSEHVAKGADYDNACVWAAANNGISQQYGVQRGYFSMLVNAKNAIKVGNSIKYRKEEMLLASSSKGPTRDGRIGPDVIAPGAQVLSVHAGTQGYLVANGTSMSSPHVTGIVALLLQKYRDTILRPKGQGLNLHDHPMWNSTARALLIHTAKDVVDTVGGDTAFTRINGIQDPDLHYGDPTRWIMALYGPGPDYATGYGLVDAEHAAALLDTNHFREEAIGQDAMRTYDITVPRGLPSLRVTLAWDDPAPAGIHDAATAYDGKLVNDLDLYLTDASGQVYRPWVLDPSGLHADTIPADGLDAITPEMIKNNPARPGIDSVNNVEVVEVSAPRPGNWQIHVVGRAIRMDQSMVSGTNQDFSLVSDLFLPFETPPAGPDLGLSGLSWTPANPSALEWIDLRARVINRGNQSTPAGVPLVVAFYSEDGTTPFARVQDGSGPLAPGQFRDISASILRNASVNVSAVADPDGAIAETDERNNWLSARITVNPMPAPWFAEDIGHNNPAGSGHYYFEDQFGFSSGGRDIWDAADEFHFVHRPLNGNGEIRAQVASLFASQPWAKAGIMIRESSAPGSKHALLALTPARGVAFQRRTQTNGISVHTGTSGSTGVYLRLARSGNTFSAYTSADGSAWTLAGSETISMPAQVQIGLALCSHIEGEAAQAAFLGVKVTGPSDLAIFGQVVGEAGNGEPGVTVSLSGQKGATALTGDDGRFSFTGLVSGAAYTVTPFKPQMSFSPQTISNLVSNWDLMFRAVPTALPVPWNSQDIGFPGYSGSTTERLGMFTMEADGDDIWNTFDSFRFTYRRMEGDGEMVARVAGVEFTDPWAKAGVMMRETLDPNSKHAFALVSAGSGIAYQRRPSTGGISYHTGTNGAAPYWVRLVRSGTTFTAYKSADGAAWTFVGSSTISMAGSIYVGLAVTSHTSAQLCTATFTNVSFTGHSPFDNADIGLVGSSGSGFASDGTYTVQGSGADIWNNSDAFHFSYEMLSGNGTIIARVAAVDNTDPWAKAGVMIRESLAPDAKYAYALVSAGSGIAFQRRTATGGFATHTGSSGGAPYWVSLVRSGDTIRAYKSTDGSSWTFIGSDTIPMGQVAYIGLAVTAHNNSALCKGTFTGVRISPSQP